MDQVPRIHFSHVGIFVADLPAMTDFYARVLSLAVTDAGDLGEARLTFLSGDPAEHHQIVLVSGRPAATGFNTINQISFRLGTLGDLRRLHQRLVDDGRVTGLAAVTHGIAWSVYGLDPEANRLEFFVDTPWYIEQPIREPMDLTLTDAEILRLT